MNLKKLEKTLKKFNVIKIEKAPLKLNTFPYYDNFNGIYIFMSNGQKHIWGLNNFDLFELKCYLKNLI